MTTTDILADLLDGERTGLADITTTVKSLADGTLDTTPADLRELCLGRITPEALAARVEHVRAVRIPLAAIADTESEHAAEGERLAAAEAQAVATIERTRARLANQLKAAEAEAAREIADLREKAAATSAKVRTARDPRREKLLTTCPHPNLVDNLNSLRSEREFVRANLAAIRCAFPAEIAKWRAALVRYGPTIAGAEETIASRPPEVHGLEKNRWGKEQVHRHHAGEVREAERVLESATRSTNQARELIEKFERELAEAEAALPAKIADLDQRIAAAVEVCVEP